MPWRNGEFQNWSRESLRLALNTFLCQNVRKCTKNDGNMSKGYSRQLEGAPIVHIEDNLEIEVNNSNIL